jgi:hypothetical protein
MRRPCPTGGCCAKNKETNCILAYATFCEQPQFISFEENSFRVAVVQIIENDEQFAK